MPLLALLPCRHTATGQLHVSVLRGTQRAASGVDHAAAAGPSTSYASAGGASSRRSSASRTPSFDVEAFDSTPTSHRRARRSQQGGGGGRRQERHSEDAGGEGGECWAWEEEEERGSGEGAAQGCFAAVPQCCCTKHGWALTCTIH